MKKYLLFRRAHEASYAYPIDSRTLAMHKSLTTVSLSKMLSEGPIRQDSSPSLHKTMSNTTIDHMRLYIEIAELEVRGAVVALQ